jgi:hypothetical protein
MDLKVIASACAVSALLISGAAHAAQGGSALKATLSGPAEKPKPGAANGSGSAAVRVDAAQSKVCYDLQVSGIGAATMAHIHKAPATAAGPVAIPLKAPGADGKVSDCTAADPTLLKDIESNPAAYYVNVHNAEFPAGAIRGQLSR